MRRLDFLDHRRELGANRYIYAVVSRRAQGLSIGINLNRDKVCNFDCPYCQVDRTTPGGPRDIEVERVGEELARLLRLVKSGELWTTAPFDTAAPELRRVADIAFAGDGEPTSPPEFPAVARVVRDTRDELGVTAPIRLLTNATLLHREAVHEALVHIDEPWCKLDAGTAGYFRVIDGTAFPFGRILQNLGELAHERPIVIQSMFCAIDGAHAPDEEIHAWAGRLNEIKARGHVSLVQVYTVARTPADSRITAIPRERLDWIAAQARMFHLNVEVYG